MELLGYQPVVLGDEQLPFYSTTPIIKWSLELQERPNKSMKIKPCKKYEADTKPPAVLNDLNFIIQTSPYYQHCSSVD